MNPLRSIIAKIKKPFAKLGSSPEYDWHFALACFTLGLIVVILIDSIAFLKMSAPEKEDSANEVASTVTINRSDIDAAIKSIEQKDLNAPFVPEVVKGDPSM